MIRFGNDATNDLTKWEELYKQLDDNHKIAFFSPEYYKAYASVEKGQYFCFWGCNDEGEFLFYPYLKRSINELGYSLDADYFDVSGAYGYNGPIGNAVSAKFINEYNVELQKELRDQNVVTEFVRYSPIPENRVYHTYPDHIHVLDNVFVDLRLGMEKLWSDSYKKRVRHAIRKAASYGLYSEIFTGPMISQSKIDLAYGIYEETMQRNDADEFYYFGLDFFIKLYDYMKEKLLLIFTYHEQTPISFELVFLDGCLSYAFLGGTLSQYYQMNPNSYLMNDLFIWLVDNGFTTYSMGGGTSIGDSLYTYKQSFSKNCDNQFFIGTKVHIPNVYDSILTQWQSKFPEAVMKHRGKLQGYRNLRG
jgi:hypothetical protein